MRLPQPRLRSQCWLARGWNPDNQRGTLLLRHPRHPRSEGTCGDRPHDRVAGALFVLPLWNPVLVAEQVSTLAAIHEGRFIIQCAIGRGDPTSSAMGVNPKFRPSMLEESLDIVRRLLNGETVSSEGRFRITDAHIAPIPPEPVEVWLSGTMSTSIDRAARLGDAWLGDPWDGLDGLAAQAAEFHERAQIHHRTPTALAVRRNIFVGKTDEDAARVVEPMLANLRGGPSSILYGSPETVAKQVKSLADLGFTDIIARSLVDDQRLTLESIERMAEVRERVRDF